MAVIIGEVEVVRQTNTDKIRERAPDPMPVATDRFSVREICLDALRERERRDLRRRCD